VFTRITKSVAGTALVAGAVGLGALLSAGAANARSVDDAFLASLEADGIQPPSSQAAISLAQDVCTSLDHGYSGTEVIQAVGKKTELSTAASKSFVIDAVQAYCPEHL
jgi:hypothetical protein